MHEEQLQDALDRIRSANPYELTAEAQQELRAIWKTSRDAQLTYSDIEQRAFWLLANRMTARPISRQRKIELAESFLASGNISYPIEPKALVPMPDNPRRSTWQGMPIDIACNSKEAEAFNALAARLNEWIPESEIPECTPKRINAIRRKVNSAANLHEGWAAYLIPDGKRVARQLCYTLSQQSRLTRFAA